MTIKLNTFVAQWKYWAEVQVLRLFWAVCILQFMIFVWIGVLITSLVVLVKSSDYFTKYSEKVGLAFGLSSFIIGATIVAIGTSLPELVSSLFAVLGSGNTEFVADNIIGSNIANALLILGIGAVVAKTLKVNTSLIDVDLPFFFSSMGLFVYFALDQQISRVEGIFLLLFFVIFLIYNIKSGGETGLVEDEGEKMDELEEQFGNETNKKNKEGKPAIGRYIFYIVLSAVTLTIGAKYLIDSILTLSELLGISSSMLTITVVALGTSLPEVITSIAAIRLGNHGIAIGNVFGSNTFNLLLIGGFPALWTNLDINPNTFLIGVPFLVLATLAAIFKTLDNKVRFWEGIALLFLYVVFLAKIVGIM